MKIAAQLYTIREFTKTPEDIKISLKKIRDIGYDTIQVSAFGPIAPELLKQYCDEYGLQICVTHTPFDRIVNETDAVIAEHKLWNCGYIGLGAMPVQFHGGQAGYDEFIKQLLPAAEKIRDAGLKFVYHNHRFEFERLENGMTGIEYLVSKTGQENFGLLADLYWVQAGGMSPIQFLKRFSDRLEVIHFKDMKVIKDQIEFAEIYNGNMDYDEIYRICLDTGIKFAAVEQDICPGDPFDSLKISLENMKAHGYEI